VLTLLRRRSFASFLFALGLHALGRERAAAAAPIQADAPYLRPRTVHAARLDGPPPTIDGIPDEAAWASAEIASEFIQSRPHPAALASLVSRARVLADDDALYVALEYDDPDARSIQAPFARRDDETTGDWAFVEIDTHHDRRTADNR